VLRRQVVRTYRKPLVLMTPKSLLRHPQAVSSLDDLAHGAFQRVIGDDHAKAAKVKRVMFCSGKVYYELLDERQKRDTDDTAIVRIEQLYPLGEEKLKSIASSFKKADDFVWVQEEPENMGAAFFIEPRLRALGINARVVARKGAASPATGSKDSHDLEQSILMKQAFGDKVD
jgi:2-oxoglutarate dehydrogenase E1 component